MSHSMKRSRVNQNMAAADEMIRHYGFVLPPFAYWTPDQFKARKAEAHRIIDARHWLPQHRERIFLVGFGAVMAVTLIFGLERTNLGPLLDEFSLAYNLGDPQQARKQAEQAGLLAMRDELAALRQSFQLDNTAPQLKSRGEQQATHGRLRSGLKDRVML